MTNKFYAVKTGKTPGIYASWEECKSQVDGYSGAIYKSFRTLDEAQVFLGNSVSAYEIISDKDNAIAYVDGSYNIATKKFSYGIVMFYDGQEYHFSEMVDDEELAEMRNVAGEIKGAEAAMQFAIDKKCRNLTIYHDYEGIAKWCLGLWKTNKAGTIAYKEFYDYAKNLINVTFIKVKGHSNDKYNDLADELAKKAIFK